MTLDQRIGRAVGLAQFVATMTAVAGLLLWPKVVGAIVATITWTDAAKSACTQTPGCAVNLVPGGVVPVGWALAWVAVIVVGIAVCWSPRRWWSSRGRGVVEVIADSSPRWLRMHAVAAVFVCVIVAIPGRGVTSAWAVEYFAPAALALVAVGLATLSLRRARRSLPRREWERLAGTGVFVDRALRVGGRRARKDADA